MGMGKGSKKKPMTKKEKREEEGAEKNTRSIDYDQARKSGKCGIVPRELILIDSDICDTIVYR